MKKRVFAMLLAAVMCMELMPAQASAQTNDVAERETTDQSENFQTGPEAFSDETGNPFPIDTMEAFSVKWTNSLGQVVYRWTNGSDDNSDQSTIDTLFSGDYRVEINFRESGYPINLFDGVRYTLQLDWPDGDDVTVSIKGGNSGTVNRTDGDVLFFWEVSETGLLSVTIGSRYDSLTGELGFTASVSRGNEGLPEGSTAQAEPSVQKDGAIDEAVDDVVTWTITAVLPRYVDHQNHGKAYEWSSLDEMTLSTPHYGNIKNDLSGIQIVMSSEEYPGGILIPSVAGAGEDDLFAYDLDVKDDSGTELCFLNRCDCQEETCGNWTGGCGNRYENTGFCTCWLYTFNATFTLTYSTDISEVMQGVEDANSSQGVRITNNVFLKQNTSEAAYDDDTEFIYRPFEKRETGEPDDNDGIGKYEIVFDPHGIDYSWNESITVTDRMDNLTLITDSLIVTAGDTVMTRISEEEAAGLSPEKDRDQYYSLFREDMTDHNEEKTGETVTIKIWYPTSLIYRIEYDAFVLSYEESETGTYSNTAAIGKVVYTLAGSYSQGGSFEGGAGYTDSMTLTKVDADQQDSVLPGAVFEIYRYAKDAGCEEDWLMTTMTTGEDGTLTFQSDINNGIVMQEDVLYYIREIHAPDGYQLADDLYGFIFEVNGYTGTYPDGLNYENITYGTAQGDGTTIHIEITRENKKGSEITGEPGIFKEIAEDDYLRKEDTAEEMHDGEDIYGEGWGTWDSADNRQEITYHLRLEDMKDNVNVTVHDYLEEGLNFGHEAEVVLYDGTEHKTLAEGDYTMTEEGCSDPAGCAMAGCTFEVKFEDSVFENISEDAYIIITYKALTDTHPEYYEDYRAEIPNHSYMTCGASSYRSLIMTTATDLFGFGVYKYANEDGTDVALAGAEFILGRDGMYATFETETDSQTGGVCYMISGWVKDRESAGVLISGADGMIHIKGLDDDTYMLTETGAPAGYEMEAETITVTVDEDGSITVDGSTGSGEAVTGHVVNVKNRKILIDIEGAKIWNDNENQSGCRPASITINLLADGETLDSITVTEADGWAWSWTDLPKYDENGEAHVYTIDEDKTEGYTPTYFEGSFDIMNTFTATENDEEPSTPDPKPGEDIPETGDIPATGDMPVIEDISVTEDVPAAADVSVTGGTPRTGDTNNICLWFVLLAGAIAGGLAVVRIRKRR